jgi:DNA-directed RNA polymerase specialized sigma24 family protein
MLHFLAKRLGSFTTASDIVQDVYLKLVSRCDLPPVSNTRSYLFRMAANQATDHQRSELRRAKILDEIKDVIWERADYLTPERHLLAISGLLLFLPHQ